MDLSLLRYSTIGQTTWMQQHSPVEARLSSPQCAASRSSQLLRFVCDWSVALLPRRAFAHAAPPPRRVPLLRLTRKRFASLARAADVFAKCKEGRASSLAPRIFSVDRGARAPTPRCVHPLSLLFCAWDLCRITHPSHLILLPSFPAVDTRTQADWVGVERRVLDATRVRLFW
jgi:hypothetical protein